MYHYRASVKRTSNYLKYLFSDNAVCEPHHTGCFLFQCKGKQKNNPKQAFLTKSLISA